MVISHKHRFIYWKPHKVASTSVMYALSKLCGEHDTSGGIADKVEIEVENYRRNMGPFSHLLTRGNHAAPGEIRAITDLMWGSDLWHRYYKFTIVRNPWDWALSLLDYAEHQLGTPLEFDDVIHSSQRHYWFSDQGAPLADSYLRFENLDQDFANVCAHLGLPSEPLPVLRRGQRDTARPYWEYYTDEMRDLIAKTFALEIDHFSYRFGE